MGTVPGAERIAKIRESLIGEKGLWVESFVPRKQNSEQRGLFFDPSDRFHEHRQDRDVIPEAAPAGLYSRDSVDDFHALDYLAEDRIAEAKSLSVEPVIVFHVDKKLRRSAILIVVACHRDRPPGVWKIAPGLNLHRCVNRLHFEFRAETASLDHEISDHTVKDRVIEKLFVNVAQEILDSSGRLLRKQFDLD